MRHILMLSAALLVSAPASHAENVLEWLDTKIATAKKASLQAPADSAILLTLENKQSEMYPLPSPDGRYLLSLSHQHKQSWITRHYSENGDPANIVSNDPHALDSINWKSDGKVYYLSDRAGGLGLWEKISDGEGMQRRIQPLQGALTQPILLADESIIAVRLKAMNYKIKKTKSSKRDPFNNWEFTGFTSEIVRFNSNGSEKILAEGINPSLSPDGNSIVFSMQAGRSIHLFRINIDGSELIQITDARSIDVQPSWSRDGKWILFTSNRTSADLRKKGKSQWDIWAIAADGRNLTQITYDTARDGAPHMGSDGRIYFHSDRTISKAQLKAHQVKSAASHSFHIWSINWPTQAEK